MIINVGECDILNSMRHMMKDMFGVNDKEIDQIIKFMGEDYEHIHDAG